MVARTLFDKVWSSHVVAELPGGMSLLAIDRHLLHDLEGGQVLERIADRGLAPHGRGSTRRRLPIPPEPADLNTGPSARNRS